MGLLGEGFYFHSISIPVVHNARYPEKNTRDIIIGYVLVLCTYIIVGCLGYYGFVGIKFQSLNPMGPAGIDQNVLNMFNSSNIMGTFMRICTFFSLLSVTALFFACER